MQINDLKTIILAFVLFLYELVVMYYFTNIFHFLLLHSITIFILIGYIYLVNSWNEEILYPVMLLAVTIGAAVFGLGGYLITALLRPIYSLFATPASVWFEGLFPKLRISLFDRVLLRIRSGWDDYSRLGDTTTLRFLFKYGSLTDKHMVLDAIIENFDPMYTDILRQALKDPQNTVRIQAGAIITKLDFDFGEELEKLYELHRESPEDMEILLHLAKHADAYSVEILEGFRQKEMADFAIKMYRTYYEYDPEDKNVWLAIGRLLYYQKDYSGFIAWYEESKKMQLFIPTLIQSWYLESMYNLKRFDECSAVVREV